MRFLRKKVVRHKRKGPLNAIHELLKEQGKQQMEMMKQQKEMMHQLGESFKEGMKDVKEGIVDLKKTLQEIKIGTSKLEAPSTSVKINQEEHHIPFQSAVHEIFGQDTVHKNGVRIKYACAVNGAACADISTLCKLLVGDDVVPAQNPYQLMHIHVPDHSSANANRAYEKRKAIVEALSKIESNKEKAAQKALTSLAESKELSSAVDTSGTSSRSKYPFFYLWKNTYAANTGMPEIASRVCPMVLEIKGYSVQNQYKLLRQALLRAHSMVEYNCLLKEVVCFASTFKQNWALRVTKSDSLEKISDGTHVVVWTYRFNFICLPSAEDIAVCWEAVTELPENSNLNRFFDEDWFRIQSAMKQLGTHDAFMGYHKISWEACWSSAVYTMHRSEESSAKGIGTFNLSHTNQPLCTVKVNCCAAVRVRKEYKAMKRLLHPDRPIAYQALFHVIGSVYFP
eukprot:gene31578-38166_t